MSNTKDIKGSFIFMAGPSNVTSSTAINGNSKVRKELLDITNRIHAAQNIKQILVDLKSGILTLFTSSRFWSISKAGF